MKAAGACSVVHEKTRDDSAWNMVSELDRNGVIELDDTVMLDKTE